MIDKLYIGQYREGDIPGILELFYISFGKKVSEEWFFWKYRGLPWSSRAYVACYEGKVVAFYGGLRLRFVFNSREFWAYQFCDIMTHPEFRAKLFSKTPITAMLNELFYRENPMDFAFGFPSLRHVRLQILRLGGEGYRFIRLYKKERLKRHHWTWKMSIKEGWESFKNGDMKEFLIKYDDDVLQLAKDEAYIRWRYIDSPLKQYRLLTLRRLNKVKGFIVFTIEDGWFNILEIFYMNIKDMVDMLISVEAYLAKNVRDIKGIRGWHHPEEPVGNYMQELGYSHEDSVPLTFRTVNKSCGMTFDIFFNRYFYRMGDYDAS